MTRYAFFDGDNIGNSIDNLFRGGKVEEAKHLSESIKSAVFEIERFIGSVEGVELIIAGGDDILIKYEPEKQDLNLLSKISNIFTQYTGLSMSCGDGDSIGQAIGNLMEAKQKNKGTILSVQSGSDMLGFDAKQTKLYIFTTSKVPDPYINVIAHCAVYFKPIVQIVLIGITEDRGKIGEKENELKELKSKIGELLDKLSRSVYPCQKRDDKGKTIFEDDDIKMDGAQRQRYNDLKNFALDLQVMVYEDLEKEIAKILNATDLSKYIFDVTTVLKSYLVDVYTILRFRNISTIFSFELRSDKRTYDYKELIHNLTNKKSYEYTCLAESEYTKDRMVVSETLVVSESKFNQLMSFFKVLEKSRNNLEDTIATDFARLISFVCSFVGFIFFIPLYLRIIQPEKWTRFEPWTFIVPTAWILISYLLQGVFKGRAPSFNPLKLFHAAKNWRQKRLEKDRLDTSVVPD